MPYTYTPKDRRLAHDLFYELDVLLSRANFPRDNAHITAWAEQIKLLIRIEHCIYYNAFVDELVFNLVYNLFGACEHLPPSTDAMLNENVNVREKLLYILKEYFNYVPYP